MSATADNPSDDEDFNPFFIKSDKSLSEIHADEMYAAIQERKRRYKEEGRSEPRSLPSEHCLRLVLGSVRVSQESITMEDVKEIWQVIDEDAIDKLYDALVVVTDQVDREYLNLTDPDNDLAAPS